MRTTLAVVAMSVAAVLGPLAGTAHADEPTDACLPVICPTDAPPPDPIGPCVVIACTDGLPIPIGATRTPPVARDHLQPLPFRKHRHWRAS